MRLAFSAGRPFSPVAMSYASLALTKIPARMAGIALERELRARLHPVGGFRVAERRVSTPEVWVAIVAAQALGLAVIRAPDDLYLPAVLAEADAERKMNG
jgi:hypothetical protein